MIKAEQARQAALDRVGDAYVYGAWDQQCTVANRNKYANLSSEYKDAIKNQCQRQKGTKNTCDGCKWQGHRIHDCRGLTSTCAKAAGIVIDGQTVARQWNANVWEGKGTIDSLPRDLPYVQLFRYNGSKWAHTGCYIGNGEVVDARGHAYGVIRSKLSDYKWTHWAIPKGMEDDVEKPLHGAGELNPQDEQGGVSVNSYSAVVSVKSGRLNLRNAPNTSGDIVERLPNGTPLTVICEYENGWAFVDEDGTQGYVCMDYIKPVNKPESASDGGGVQTPTDEQEAPENANPAAFTRYAVLIPCDSEEEARRRIENIKGAILIRYDKPPGLGGEGE